MARIAIFKFSIAGALIFGLCGSASFGQSIFNDQPGKTPPPATPEKPTTPEKPADAPTTPSKVKEPAPKKETAPPPKQAEVFPAPKEVEFTLPRPAEKKDELPAATAVISARAAIKGVFKEDFKKTANKDRRELIAKLFKQADDPANDAATQHAVLLELNALAAAAGDADSIILIIDEMERRYPVASLELQLKLLEAGLHEIQLPDAIAKLADCCLAVADDAAWSGNYRLALRAADQAMIHARRSKSAPLIRQVQFKSDLYREVSVAMDLIDRPGGDPTADVARGCAKCFLRDDWQAGLTLIAGGSDHPLAALAEKDLANPPEPAEMITLADSYFDFASETITRPVLRKLIAAYRARFWYAKAFDSLNGLLKAHAEKRRHACDALCVGSWSRVGATTRLRENLIAARWTWNAPDVVMSFRQDGSVSHRGMAGNFEVASPRHVVLRINNGDVMTLWFNSATDHYTSLARGISGERVER